MADVTTPIIAYLGRPYAGSSSGRSSLTVGIKSYCQILQLVLAVSAGKLDESAIVVENGGAC